MRHAVLLVALVFAAAIVGLGTMYFLTPPSAQMPAERSPTVDDVRAALGEAVGGEADSIQIEVEGSRVRLAGRAPSADVRDRALRAARSVPGVAEVDNRITITPDSVRVGPARHWRA